MRAFKVKNMKHLLIEENYQQEYYVKILRAKSEC